MSIYDENDDPLQYGLHGWQDDSDGVTHMKGSCMGIVLSVHAADSTDSEWYNYLQGDISDGVKASYLEAQVYILSNGSDLSIILPNVLVSQGKSSRYSSAKGAKADWTEDVPNGCTPEELQDFYDSSSQTKIEKLSGDWVVVDFLGGLLQLPYISRYYPNPFNRTDAATTDDGSRYLMRRNGTETKIDKNGDVFISTRGGNYVTSEGENFSFKNSKGQVIRTNSDGKVIITDAFGNIILLDEDGVSYSNGQTSFEVNQADVRVHAPSGNATILADTVNMFGNSISATGGGNGKPLTHEQLALDYKALLAAFTFLLDALKNTPAAPAIQVFEAAFDLTTLKLKNGITPATPKGVDQLTQIAYLTKIFTAD